MANEPSEMQQQARMLAPRLFDAFNDGANTFEDVVTLGWDSLDEENQAGWEGVALLVLQREGQLVGQVTRVIELVNNWQFELDEGRIRSEDARYCWQVAVNETRSALYGGGDE